jgi:hypothetical protein
VTYTMLRASQYLKDNRLTPAGFDKAVVPDDVKVVGNAAQDPNFNLGEDSITYLVPVIPGSYEISAELIYQPVQYAFMQDLLQDIALPEVADFNLMYSATASLTDVIVGVVTNVVVGG